MTRGPISRFVSGIWLPLASLALAAGVVISSLVGLLTREDALPAFEKQLCGIPKPWLIKAQRGYRSDRSGHIAILPRYPAYLGTSEGGWSHSGPWGYLQRVPLVFYGPGFIDEVGSVERTVPDVTLADVAPTLMRLMRGSLATDDGDVLAEVAKTDSRLVARDNPRLMLVIVWDGGGWNVLERWPEAWPNLARLMERGVSYTDATVGSSPSVTPSVHTTLGTGVFPWIHGITGIPVKDEQGVVQDAFLKGESARFMDTVTLAERWDEHTSNRARIGMLGYEPWHLGMIGRGAEDPTGDKDDAVWLDRETNEWASNIYYRLPTAVESTGGLDADIARLDATDGESDQSWGSLDILEDQDRLEETPAFVAYHGRALRNLIADGYGSDDTTDLLFTNFKQIDRLGHYFNMESDEVRQALEATDVELGRTVDFLNEHVGKNRWVTVITADHGQQPDAADVDGYGIDPKEVARDIDDEFGPVTRAVWPTEVFLEPDADVDVADVARFLGDYRLAENTQRPDILVAGSGRFEPDDRLFQVAVPAPVLERVSCGVPRGEMPSR